MRASLENLCNKFISNRDTIKGVFKWENDQIIAASATTFLNRGMEADAAKLETCKKVLKENTGVFSNFRGNVEIPMVAQLALADVPEDKMRKTLKIYDDLKQEFMGSEYLVLAAAVMADMVSEDQSVKMAEKARSIYNKMKKDHPFLTSGEDAVYAVLMSISEKNDETLMEEMEVCYKKLKETFSASNEVQALAHVLSIAEGSAEEKCNKVVALFEALRDAGVKYGKYHELVVLASLALLPVEKSVLVEEIEAVDAFLTEQKGYGFFGLDKKTRLMHAAMIVSCDYVKNDNADVAAMTGTLAAVAAQQAAMCAVIASSVAASSAANAGN